MSQPDAQLAQYAAAGLTACGLLVTVGARFIFPARVPLHTITAKNPVVWAPRGFGGVGKGGKSPVFGIMWVLVYGGQLFYTLALLTATARGDVSSDVSMVFNHAACVYAALLTSSLWSALFSEQKRWCFVLASCVLVSTALFSLVGAVVAKPFLSGRWWSDVGGAATSFLAGWATVAAGIGVGTVTRVYNRGVDNDYADGDERSFFPLVLSAGLALVAVLFANPTLLLPLLISTFFMRGFLSDWRIWAATLVCAVGMAISIAMIFVYRGTGLFW